MEENSDLWAELTGNEPHAAASGGGGNGSGGRPRRRHHARSVAHIPLGQGGAGNQLADQFIQSLIANLTGLNAQIPTKVGRPNFGFFGKRQGI